MYVESRIKDKEIHGESIIMDKEIHGESRIERCMLRAG